MLQRLVVLLVLALAAAVAVADAQQGSGEPFGARDPRTCASREAGLFAAQAHQYFICDSEQVTQSIASGALLYLVTDITVDTGKGRPFNMQSDSFGFATHHGIDPSQTVYPIRGSFTRWQCVPLGHINGEAGKNCSKLLQPQAKGICFKTTFGEWHCTMTDFDHNNPGMDRYPPPTGPQRACAARWARAVNVVLDGPAITGHCLQPAVRPCSL